MIELTILGKHGDTIYINPHQIEYITCKPDTTLIMLSGKKIVVSESYKDVYKRIVDYRKEIGGFKNEE